MYNYSKLLGAIKESGKTQETIAKSIGMSVSTFNAKLKGKSQFKASEMQHIMSVLSLPEGDIALYFFAH